MQQHQATEDTRYDAETLKKVTALAQRLQFERQETLTAREMEQIGEEVGLERSLIREALRAVTAPKPVIEPRPNQTHHMRAAVVRAWWSTGWLLPFIVALMVGFINPTPGPAILSWLVSWAVYISGGIILTGWRREGEAAFSQELPVSRHDLLEALFTLQHVLEGHKEHRAFLSVDVAGSTEMKLGASELAVEYSFGQLQQWLSQIAHSHGGELHSAAGDGMMCVFREDTASLKAARAIQEGIAEFNRLHNRLSQPFRLRCAVTAGAVAIDPGANLGQMHSHVIDRAATLQKQAQPGDIVVSGELAAAGLVELGRLASTTARGSAEPVFSWTAATAQRSASEP